MSTIYIFTTNNVRSSKDQNVIEQFRAAPNAVVDPDLSAVRCIPRHHWKLSSKKKVVSMSVLEKIARDNHIGAHGADNALAPQKIRHPMVAASAQALKPLLYIGIGALMHHLIGVL